MSIRANYEEIPGIASQMSSEGSDISRLIADAYKKVDGLKSTWTGKRYNTVASDFNSLIPDINSLEKLMISSIPVDLGTVAKNYANVDGGTAPAVSEASIVTTEEISDAATTPLTFDSGVAMGVLEQVKSNFSSVQDDIEKYKSQFDSLDWDSPAADNYRSQMETLTGRIREAFSNLCSAFEKAMTQAQEDIEKADSANNL